MFIKRSFSMLQNRSIPDVRDKREAWKKHMLGSNINNLIFLDESSVNINMTRHYVRSKTDERAVDGTPLNTPSNTRSCHPYVWMEGQSTPFNRVGQPRNNLQGIWRMLCYQTCSRMTLSLWAICAPIMQKQWNRYWTHPGLDTFICRLTAQI